MKAATSWQDSVAKATVKDGSGGAIRLRLVPVTFFAEFIGKEMAAAVQKRTFAGMRDSGPDPQNPRQMELFKSKVKNWGVLMSNLGLVSGHFARDLRSGMSCQDLPSRALRANAAEHMAQSHSDVLETAPTQSRLKMVIDIQGLIRVLL